jgi:hypothetical protein
MDMAEYGRLFAKSSDYRHLSLFNFGSALAEGRKK